MHFFTAILTAVALLSMPIMSHAEVSIGQAAPDFSLKDTNGKSYSLSNAKGNFVVLEWFNFDCPFVKKHYDSGNMQGLQKEYADKGVVWLAINSSAVGKQGHYAGPEMQKLAEEQNMAVTDILLDTDGAVGKLYGAQTTPHMYIIDPKGILIYQGAIDDTPSADKEDIATSKNYVKAALNEALAGKPVTEASTKAYGCSVKY